VSSNESELSQSFNSSRWRLHDAATSAQDAFDFPEKLFVSADDEGGLLTSLNHGVVLRVSREALMVVPYLKMLLQGLSNLFRVEYSSMTIFEPPDAVRVDRASWPI
jgi:hypothetical protein